MESPPPSFDMGWTERQLSQEEMAKQQTIDPDLDPELCKEILARLNGKDRRYVERDIKNGTALKVPNDFRAYKTWSPLPGHLSQIVGVHKFILITKDTPFIGWYANGKLLDDSQICIGKKRNWTKAGLYRVMDKDVDHVSSSYRSAYGYPALMPYALRIYGHVWIHGGDVVGGYCSHGCINLPLDTAETLFQWADHRTIVLIVESMADLKPALDKYANNKAVKR